MDKPQFKALYQIEKTAHIFTEFHAVMKDGTLARLRWTPAPTGLGKFEIFAVEIEDHRPVEETPSPTYTPSKTKSSRRI
jgi:hypothetical protein